MRPDSRSIVRVVAIAVGVIGVAVLVAVTARALLMLFAGVLVALTLRGAAELAVRRTGASYRACLAAVVAVLLAATTVGIVVAAPRLYEQASVLARDLPPALQLAAENARRTPLGFAVTGGGKFAPESSYIAAATRDVLSISIGAVGALVIVFFIGVFGAAQPGLYARAAVQLFPEDVRPRVSMTLGRVRLMLTRWLLGRVVAMTFMGVSAWIAFALLKLPLAAFLALLTGLLAFVEYAGAIAAAIPPIILAFAESPKKAFAVGVVYTVLHVIEGYVLTPILARAAVRVPPAIVLAGQVVLGAAVGVIGLTFSTPLMVVGIAVVETLRGRQVADEERPSRRRLSLA